MQTKLKTHLLNLKHTTPKVSAKNASLEGTVAVINGNSSSKVKAILKDNTGKIVADKIVVAVNGLAKIKFKNIKNPKLWDTDAPNL